MLSLVDRSRMQEIVIGIINAMVHQRVSRTTRVRHEMANSKQYGARRTAYRAACVLSLERRNVLSPGAITEISQCSCDGLLTVLFTHEKMDAHRQDMCVIGDNADYDRD